MIVKRDIFTELLKMRGLTEETARVAVDFFCEVAADNDKAEVMAAAPPAPPPAPSGTSLERDAVGRMLIMAMDIFHERLAPEERERFKEKLLRML